MSDPDHDQWACPATRTRIGGPTRPWRQIGLTGFCAAALLLSSGCASKGGYRFGRFHPEEPEGIAPGPVVVQEGKPNKTLDRLGWLAGLPERIFTLNPKASNHKVSPETLEKLQTYLEENDITDVEVAVNDYDPKGQWQRLRENDRISPFWKYSAGSLTWLGYTLMPYRVFGGDAYNPFTNSLNITSDVPALVLAEAAYAKDIHGQARPGAYATISELPVLSLVRHGRATSDVLGYARARNDWEGEKEAYHVLYPQVGSTTFGPAAHFVPVVGPLMAVGGALAGHATGRTMTAILEPQRIGSSPESDSSAVMLAGASVAAYGKSSSADPEDEPPEEDRMIQADYQESRPSRPAR